MRTPHLILISVIAAAASMAAQAQQQTATTTAPSPAASAPMAADCAKGVMKPHDHGVEKGYGPRAMKPCAPAPAAAEPVAPAARAKKAHDHSTFHKLM